MKVWHLLAVLALAFWLGGRPDAEAKSRFRRLGISRRTVRKLGTGLTVGSTLLGAAADVAGIVLSDKPDGTISCYTCTKHCPTADSASEQSGCEVCAKAGIRVDKVNVTITQRFCGAKGVCERIERQYIATATCCESDLCNRGPGLRAGELLVVIAAVTTGRLLL